MNLKELSAQIGLEEEEYRELLSLFVETGRQDYERLKIAFAQGDDSSAARAAHTMSGAAGNMRIMELHEQLKIIEAAATDGQLAQFGEEIEAIGSQLDELDRWTRT